jgi:hypothetical protein
MKFLYQTVLTSIVTLALFSVTVVQAVNIAGTINLDAYDGVYPGSSGDPAGGGEFTAYTSQDFYQYYANGATYEGGFETFCTEVGVEFTPANWGGPTYTYSLGNITQPISGGGEGSDTALTEGTAWLYYEFATGNLNNYSYTYGSAREADATLLQAAIWALQGGQSDTADGYASLATTEADNPYYLAAIAALGAGNVDDAYTGGTVLLLQLWDGTTPVQNQLVLTSDTWSVPDGGFTLILLGIGLIGIFFFRSLRSQTA